ncbi:MAG TPA: hypothetical protein VF832_15175, partial [Longimicrobiales bacterium]
LSSRSWALLATVAALIAVGSTLGRARMFALSYPLKVLLLALLLVQLLKGGERGLAALLDRPIMRWLGTMSYSVYLYHYLAWVVVGWMIDRPIMRGVVGAALTLPMAVASYYVVERPCLRLRERTRPAPASPGQPELHTGIHLGSATA